MTKTALISVYNKTGIVDFAKELYKLGYTILSTGGTASLLRKNNIDAIEVSEYTGSPELLDGLVKTLHPKIHAGILADRENNKHIKELNNYKIKKIDMVVVNLYPFEDKPTNENIDIGGVTLIRSAAKNFENVAVLTDIKDYDIVLKELKNNDGKLGIETLKKLAVKALGYVARYDALIYNTLNKNLIGEDFPDVLALTFNKIQNLRYGENPHQKAAFYIEPKAEMPSVATAKKLHGKELSFNNILDANDALEIVREFTNPTAGIIKHTNPCGVASRDKIETALKVAYEADTDSAYGGVIALNRQCNLETAKLIMGWFVEVVICPRFDKKALELLSQKKYIRLLETGKLERLSESYDMRKTIQGLLLQSSYYPEISEKDLKVVTKRKPTKAEIAEMLFAYKVNKHLKSNSVVITRNNATIGIGAGQTSRVFAVKIAVMKAREKAKGSVMSSDAFFPFRDSIDIAAKAGITAIIQPGGSIRDKEVIDACNKYNIAMVFTGVRLFKH